MTAPITHPLVEATPINWRPTYTRLLDFAASERIARRRDAERQGVVERFLLDGEEG